MMNLMKELILSKSYSTLSSKDVGLEVLIADTNDDYYDDYMDLIDEEMRSLDEESMSKWDLTVNGLIIN